MYCKGSASFIFLSLAFSLLLSGCTSLGSHIISNPATYLSDSRLGSMDLERFDTEKRHMCIADDEGSQCLHYLYAKAYQPQDFEQGQHVQYQVFASGNGVENHLRFEASPQTFNRMSGTAVLFHGFGGSKEAMLVTSIWFRALGFNIIAVDLFGHGESEQDFVFGAKEHKLFAKVIESINKDKTLPQPLIAVGHSMGSLPAINTLNTANVLDGAIIMAPMVRFDEAAKHYLAYKSELLKSLFSRSMDNIVSDAMQKRTVSVTDTDVPRMLKKVQKPVLILSSDVDTVSPASAFGKTGNALIQQEIIPERSHPSLIAFDNTDTEIIEGWLKQHFSKTE